MGDDQSDQSLQEFIEDVSLNLDKELQGEGLRSMRTTVSPSKLKEEDGDDLRMTTSPKSAQKLERMKTQAKFKHESSWQALYNSIASKPKYKNMNSKLPQFALNSSIINFKEFFSLWTCLPTYV